MRIAIGGGGKNSSGDIGGRKNDLGEKKRRGERRKGQLG